MVFVLRTGWVGWNLLTGAPIGQVAIRLWDQVLLKVLKKRKNKQNQTTRREENRTQTDQPDRLWSNELLGR